MSPAKAKAGERLPYLLGKLKAPRVLERLEQTAALARDQAWPYEQFLESLLEAEVFARDASGARMRIRAAAFPALKTLEDFDWSAQPSAERPLVLHLGAARLDRGASQRLLLRAARHRQDPPRGCARTESLRARLPRRLRDRPRMGLPARASTRPQPARGGAAPPGALPPADRRRGRLPPARTPGREPALRARLASLRTRLDHRHQQPRLRAMGRDPRRRHGRRRPDRPVRPPRNHDHAQRQKLPPARTRPRRQTRRPGHAAPRLRLSSGGHRSGPIQARKPPQSRSPRNSRPQDRPSQPPSTRSNLRHGPSGALFDARNWRTIRCPLTTAEARASAAQRDTKIPAKQGC